jgi:polyhydroxybutyrate depolymerase
LNEALRLSPANYFAYRTRGLVYEKNGQFEPALADFRVALRADPDRKENLGLEAAEGIERVEKLLRAAPKQSTPQPFASRGELIVGGRVRTYQATVAATPGARPTIIHLHGVGSSGAREAQVTGGLGQLAPRDGFTVVYPDGLGARWNYFPAGKVPSSYTQSFQTSGGVPDDVAFIRMLVADLVRRGLSDSHRVNLVGTSAGGIMALRMVCVDARLFAAVGILIAAMPDSVGDGCRPEKPIPALLLSGTADRFLPYGGGAITSADPRLLSGELGSVWSMERLFAFFRRLNGCASPTNTSSVTGHDKRIEIDSAGSCSGGPVRLYRIVGGGHEVPGSLNVGSRLLDFFRDRIR